MKLSVTILLALAVRAAIAQTPSAYEPPPVLKASEILQPAYLTGLHHKVREEVTTNVGVNRFVIDSPFGTFVAQGNPMLADRVNEISALAKLRDMSNTSQYVAGMKEAAKVPFETIGDLVTSPVDTIGGVPKGVGKFLGRVGRGAKDAVSGRDRGEGEDSMVKRVSGVAQAKRELCAELGVNPYSSNEILQQELERAARAVTFGKLTVKAALMPVGGAAGSALSALSAIDATNNIVYTQNPLDLRKANLGRLKDMSITSKDAEAFLANSSFSPWHQTRIVTALEQLVGVTGREVFIRDATAMTASEPDAVFYEQTARLIAHAHTNGIAVHHIMLVNGFPVCVGADGGVIVALQWDYAMLSLNSERFATALQSMQVNGAKPSSLIVVLTGSMSPKLRKELEKRCFRVQDKLLKGPLI